MSGAGNIFYGAGKAVLAALDRHARAADPATLLEGSDGEVADRWACSAVKLQTAGRWLVVPNDSLQVEGSNRRIRAYEGGVISGRAKHYSWAWLLQNAESVALGSLVLGDQEGAGARFSDGTGSASTLVVRDGSESGEYEVDVTTADGVRTMGLGAALVLVGAAMTKLDGSTVGTEEATLVDFPMSLGGEAGEKAVHIVKFMEELGCVSADTHGVTLSIADMAGVLCVRRTRPAEQRRRRGYLAARSKARALATPRGRRYCAATTRRAAASTI